MENQRFVLRFFFIFAVLFVEKLIVVEGVEIAFSPLLQTDDGAVLLPEDWVDSYISILIENIGDGWTKEALIAADVSGIYINLKLKCLNQLFIVFLII